MRRTSRSVGPRGAGGPLAFLALAFALGCAGLTAPPPTVVVVTAEWDGADALSVEQNLLEPLEHAISAVPGVQRIDGRADDGVATVELTLSNDDVGAIRDALPLSSLPADADLPVVVRREGGVQWLSVPRDRAEAVAREIETSPGVSEVVRHGGGEHRIEVRVDPARLQAYGLDVTAVIDGLRACNAELPAGRIAIRAEVDPSTLSDCPIGTVRVGDLATVSDVPGEITALGPDGPVALLEVRTKLDRIVHLEASPPEEPLRVRPADLRALGAAWPRATVLADGDDALLWADPAGAPPGFEVWAPQGEVHEVVVTGPEIDEIAALVQVVRAQVGLPTWTDLPPERPEWRFTIDRVRAAELGVSVASVADAIAVLQGGLEVGRAGDAEIRLIIDGVTLANAADVGLRAADGSRVPLSDLATVSTSAARSIVHKDRQRGASILVDGEVPDLSGIPIPTGMAVTVRP